MFLLDLFRKQARGRTPYEGFEQIILCILVFIISVIIVYALILVIITLADDFRAGIVYMETGAMKDAFGLILTVIILLEFNHSIVLAIRQRSGAVQVRIIVLITIIVLAGSSCCWITPQRAERRYWDLVVSPLLWVGCIG